MTKYLKDNPVGGNLENFNPVGGNLENFNPVGGKMTKYITQDFIYSNIEALVNTLASMTIFIGFGLSPATVFGLTLSIYLKNIGIRRIFVYITKQRKAHD